MEQGEGPSDSEKGEMSCSVGAQEIEDRVQGDFCAIRCFLKASEICRFLHSRL